MTPSAEALRGTEAKPEKLTDYPGKQPSDEGHQDHGGISNAHRGNFVLGDHRNYTMNRQSESDSFDDQASDDGSDGDDDHNRGGERQAPPTRSLTSGISSELCCIATRTRDHQLHGQYTESLSIQLYSHPSNRSADGDHDYGGDSGDICNGSCSDGDVDRGGERHDGDADNGLSDAKKAHREQQIHSSNAHRGKFVRGNRGSNGDDHEHGGENQALPTRSLPGSISSELHCRTTKAQGHQHHSGYPDDIGTDIPEAVDLVLPANKALTAPPAPTDTPPLDMLVGATISRSRAPCYRLQLHSTAQSLRHG